MTTKTKPPASEREQQTKAKIDSAGRIVIPVEFRKALGVQSGEYLILRMVGSELRAWTFDEGIRRAQKLVRTFVPSGVSLVDELIADRRKEAARENDGE